MQLTSHASSVLDTSEDANQAKLATYGIGEEDQVLLRKCGETIRPRLDEFLERWYDWLRGTPEFELFFTSDEQLARAQSRQIEYWKEFFEASHDAAYFESRRNVASVHVRIGLPLAPYFAGMNQSLEIFTDMLSAVELSEQEQIGAMVRAIHRHRARVSHLLGSHEPADCGAKRSHPPDVDTGNGDLG